MKSSTKSRERGVGFLKEGDAEEMWNVIGEMREKSRERTLRINQRREDDRPGRCHNRGNCLA